MASAIIMAGGLSLRMRDSLGQTHKALVKVLGVTMLERNIVALLSQGFTEIFLAVNAREESVLAYASDRGRRLARSCNAELKLIVEKRALGTIGAAAKVRSAADDLVVVNVDNLTTLDLSAFLQHHRSRKAAMTIATHTEPFQIPFGRVTLKDGKVIAYDEKPVIPVLVSSGTYILHKKAIDLIPRGRAVGAPELFHILWRERRMIAAFEHSSPWIDVNDAASVHRAESLIIENSRAFELWRSPPERNLAVACFVKGKTVALLNNRNGSRSKAKLPVVELENGERPETAVTRDPETGGFAGKGVRALASFDEIDVGTQGLTRYHVILIDAEGDSRWRKDSGIFLWGQIDKLSSLLTNSDANTRTIRYLERFAADSYSLGH